jgi:monovalent cation/hydrogen antiporter
VDILAAGLLVLVVIGLLFEVARRLGVPYPSLFMLGGLVLAVIPGIPHLQLAPDLVLFVFLPPLLFGAAFELPQRDLRENLAPILRLAIGLVIFTMVVVAVVAHATVGTMGWAAAFALGAIVAPTDPLAAIAVFRRAGVPRQVVTILEGEALFNDATALVAYRAAVAAAISGSFVLVDAVGGFAIASVGGILIGVVVGRALGAVVHRLDNPPVEVALSLVIPYAAYLPADELGLSGVLAAVAAGLMVGRRLGTILTPQSRVLWLSTWEMLSFVLNGFAFVLIGSALPNVLAQVAARPSLRVGLIALAVCLTVVGGRIIWIALASLLPGSPSRRIAARDPVASRRFTVLAGWSGLRGAVSLAAALALPLDFPDRYLILLLTLAVIAVTLLGQGLSLPLLARWAGGPPPGLEGDEWTLVRETAYRAGLAEIDRVRPRWPTHQPLLDRLQAGLEDRTQHLATADPDETEERRLERLEHEEIQRGVITAQRAAVIDLRERGDIDDQTLRSIERELDLEELRMEA